MAGVAMRARLILAVTLSGVVGGTGTGSGFATKTSYFANANLDTSLELGDGCSPLLFWHLARHGTRNPGDDDILDMAQYLPRIRDDLIMAWGSGQGELDGDTVYLLGNWTFSLAVEDASKLTESGAKEHFDMGARWKKRLQGLLNIDSESIQAIATYKQRTLASAEAFLHGFVEEPIPVEIDNHLTRFYDECEAYQANVGESTAPLQESLRFEASEFYQEMLDNVIRRTGTNLSPRNIELIWEICRFELAWYPGMPSPWCNAFSSADLEIMEFREDLEYYYYTGYGYPITREMTQPLWQDLIDRMREIERTGRAGNSSVLLFAHSETLQPFMAALGIRRDPAPLLASDWPAAERQWRTSVIGSFATNLDLVVLQCNQATTKNEEEGESSEESSEDLSEEDESSEESSEEEKTSQDRNSLKRERESNMPEVAYKVLLFHQETLLALPHSNLSSLGDFIAQYSHLANANFEEICKL